MDYTELEAKILQYVSQPNYQPVKPKVITKKLGLPALQRSEVRKAVKRLTKQGALAYDANHVVRKADPKKPSTDIIGTFSRTSGGFGFVRPRGVAHDPAVQSDIYIPTKHTGDASNGDLVRVRLRGGQPTTGDRRQRGEIVEIVERETHQFVGTYRPRAGYPLVRVDGNVFSQPVPVGDPGAKGVVEGDKVVIEMVRFPSHAHEGEAVIVEVLGPRGAPGVDTLSIIREFNLPDDFAEEVLDSARDQAARFDGQIGDDRVDLTATTVITIDPADARDFDDAISLETLPNGHWRLGVHIADVAHFVPAKSPLDREARERATSVYLPDRVIPMLPEIISNHLASLQPDQIRFAKSVFMELSQEGIPIATEIERSAIKSDHRFNYDEVDQYLENAEPWRERLTPQVFDLLGKMHRLAMILRRRRLDNGSIEMIMPEIKIDLDTDGRVAGAHVEQYTESHQIIEEFMLAANEAVAQWLTDQQWLFLRRIHTPPSPTKLRDLTEFVRELGIPCDSLVSRFEIIRVLQQVAGRPEQQAVNYAVLRSMQKAVYGPQTEGHYALHKTHYCHFTSPIRRYPDLTVHRLLDVLAAGKKPRNDLNEQAVLGQHCSEREQRAAAAERELVKVKLLNYLSERLGEEMRAVITGVEEFGLFAQGIELPADGLIHVSSLQDDYYDYDATTRSLVGRRTGIRYRLGDVVQVEVFHIDVDRRELDFRLVRRLGRPQEEQPAVQAEGQRGKRGTRTESPETRPREASGGRTAAQKNRGKAVGKKKAKERKSRRK